jgi:nicotinamide mononucleotide (NMN) deamidase PncC
MNPNGILAQSQRLPEAALGLDPSTIFNRNAVVAKVARLWANGMATTALQLKNRLRVDPG